MSGIRICRATWILIPEIKIRAKDKFDISDSGCTKEDVEFDSNKHHNSQNKHGRRYCDVFFSSHLSSQNRCDPDGSCQHFMFVHIQT